MLYVSTECCFLEYTFLIHWSLTLLICLKESCHPLIACFFAIILRQAKNLRKISLELMDVMGTDSDNDTQSLSTIIPSELHFKTNSHLFIALSRCSLPWQTQAIILVTGTANLKRTACSYLQLFMKVARLHSYQVSGK